MPKERRATFTDYVSYMALRVAICVFQAMRVETGAMVMRFAAWLFCDVLKIRRAVTDENLRHAFPEMSADERHRLMRQMWENLLYLVLEVAHSPRKIHETNWREYVDLEHSDRAVRALLQGRSVMVVTAHFGNFEVAGYVLAILGFPSYSVARPLDNPLIDRFLNRFRSGTGQHIVAKHGEYDQIEQILGNAGTMAFLADQYAGAKGCWVDFFGRKASAHKAIALLSLANDAIVLTTASYRREPMRFCLDTTAEFDPRRDRDLGTIRGLTEWYTQRLEEMIRNQPGQYWWLHRRWKDTRERAKKKRQQRKAA